MEASSITLDVFGRRVLVERDGDAWRAYRLGDGKRTPFGVYIPASLTIDEIVQYLDDLYHEEATAKRPAVVRIG